MSTLLALSDLHERFDYLERLPEVVKNANVEGVVFTGNILRAEAREAEWRRAQEEGRAPDLGHPDVARERSDDAESLARFFRTLRELKVPVYLIPGRNDAPERFFLQAAFNSEVVAANIYMVHRSFAPWRRNFVVAGFGGEITHGEREHEALLLYPGWEAQFSLDFVRHLDQDKILLFHTPPVDKFEEPGGHPGHDAVSHIIKTYEPKFAICSRAGGPKGKMMVGTTLVVCPGQLSEGEYALLDTDEREVAFGNLR